MSKAESKSVSKTPIQHTQTIDPEKVVIIGLDTDDGAEHPLYDARAFEDPDQALAGNLLQSGCYNAILLAPEPGSDRLLVVDGRRRVRSARVANEVAEAQGWPLRVKLPYTLVSADTELGLRSAVITTNELRNEDTILNRARKARAVLDQGGTLQQLALTFGKAEQTIRDWLKLLETDARVQEAVEKGDISPWAGIQLARIEDKDAQLAALDELVKGQKALTAGATVAKSIVDAALEVTPASSLTANASTKTSGSKGGTTAGAGRAARQSGVRRTVLRAALETKAAESLTEDQRGVLDWVANGTEPGSETWYTTFAEKASAEIAADKEAKRLEREAKRLEREQKKAAAEQKKAAPKKTTTARKAAPKKTTTARKAAPKKTTTARKAAPKKTTAKK
jgi:ParB family chromosome partitioning protein